jgi:hypothetical protein
MKKVQLTTLAAAMLAVPLGASAAGLTLSGYVDTSYTYLSSLGAFNGAADDIGGNGTTLGGFSRVYDTQRNSFNLHAVSLTSDFDAGNGFGGFLQIDYGRDAATNESSSTYTAFFDNEVNVQEANVRYKSGNWTIIGGKFATLAGAEVIESYQNWNFSRSILFGYTIPFTHTGVRAAFAPSTQLTVFAGVNNGWDVLEDVPSVAGTPAPDGKTVELGVAWAPVSTFGLNGAIYVGDEAGVVSVGRRDLLDVTATIGPFGPWTFKANVDVAQQEDAFGPGADAEWTGIAGYVNFQINPQWRVAGRLEQLDDENGFRTGVRPGTVGAVGQKWSEGTITVAYAPNANVELRGELRHDSSDVNDAFIDGDGINDDDTQDSLGLEAIVRF